MLGQLLIQARKPTFFGFKVESGVKFGEDLVRGLREAIQVRGADERSEPEPSVPSAKQFSTLNLLA